MITNLIIFLLKIIENTMSTLRLIVVANGKKKIGALLNGIISFIWIFSTSIVIININKNISNIFFFIMGATIGSYLGSILEEKIALGNIIFICKINKNKDLIIKKLEKNIYKIYIDNNLLIFYLKRKKRDEIYKVIKKCDNKANIICLKAKKIV